MSYRELHAKCQGLGAPISRDFLRDEVVRLTHISGVRHFRAEMNTNHCRGFYVSSKNLEHPFVKQAGTDVIVTARDLDEIEAFSERFVFVKELMHIFDAADEMITTPAIFEQVVDDLTSLENNCAQTLSERKCIWMALMVLCPEQKRQEYERKLHDGLVDLYKISLDLKVPMFYVRYYFHPAYSKWADLILQREQPTLKVVKETT